MFYIMISNFYIMISKRSLYANLCISIFFLTSFTGITFSQTYIPGNTYFGAKGYIEYSPGTLPIILSAPHGGDLKPADIPDRVCPACITGKDGSVQEIVRDVREALFHITGRYPHIVINLLARAKLDANREIVEAACGNVDAEQSWYDYNAFIDSANKYVVKDWGKGFYIDIHSHGHAVPRLELGYLLTQEELAVISDALLNASSIIVQSSIRNLAGSNINFFTHAQLLRGDFAFGSMLADKGYRSVPSNDEPYPLSTESYFNGGYNTHRHSSHLGGTVDGVQIETNSGVRSTTSVRQKFAYELALTILDYLKVNYFPDIKQTYSTNNPDGAISFTAMEVPVTENFDNLGTNDINLYDNDAKFPGLYSYRELSNGIPQTFTKYLTSSLSGKHYNFGNSTIPGDRAPGVIYSSTTGSIGFGLRFRNNTGSEIKSLVISFTGEEWRSGSGGPTELNQLTFDYRQAASFTDLTTGSYTAVDALTFTAPYVGAAGSTAITLDGNNSAYRRTLTATVNVSIPAGQEIMLRWSDITNDADYDCALAIDDLSVIPKTIASGNEDIYYLKNVLVPYPNPVNDILNIDNTTVKADVLEIYDITGSRLIIKEVIAETVTINVSALSKGLYIIKMARPGKTYSGRFIKN
jgi:hypothetical protein